MAEDDNTVNEPAADYGTVPSKKKITIFNSFEEAEEFGLKQMAGHSYEQRLENLEILRKRIYGHLPRQPKTITIIKGTPRSSS